MTGAGAAPNDSPGELICDPVPVDGLTAVGVVADGAGWTEVAGLCSGVRVPGTVGMPR